MTIRELRYYEIIKALVEIEHTAGSSIDIELLAKILKEYFSKGHIEDLIKELT